MVRRRAAPSRTMRPGTLSKRRIAAVDHEAVGGVIGGGVAHQIHRDAAEIGGLAEPPRRDPRHHIGNEFFVRHQPGGHVAPDPAGQDRVGGDAVPRQFDRERAAQRVDRGLGRGIMLVARGAEQRGEARGRNQPAEAVAGPGAFGHVACRRLKHVEHAVEIGREHLAPFVLGAVDESAPSAAADAGIGEAAVDPAEGVERGLHGVLDGGWIGHIADAGIDLARAGRHGRGGAFVFFRIAAPDRDVAATERKCLGDAEAYAAITAGDDGHAAGEVENTHGVFPSGVSFEAFPSWYDAHQLRGCYARSMDKPAAKIKYGSKDIRTDGSAERGPQLMRKPMQFKHVTLETDGPVAILKLDHQEVMNAVSMDMLGGLAEALDAVDDRKDEVRCLVLTGAGRAFCTGANLQGRNNQKPGKSNAGAALETAFHPFLRRLRNLRCPIVTAVNGPAAGAGMSFALMGDMILCARSAYFLQAFRRIGLVPDCGSTWLLPRLIGKARSVELSLMGERLPAEKALEWGLVNRVHDDADLMAEAMKLAHDLANGPTIALSLIRKLYWDSSENSYEEQLNLEFESQRIAGSAEDFKEGVTAFLEKRPAKFKGK